MQEATSACTTSHEERDDDWSGDIPALIAAAVLAVGLRQMFEFNNNAKHNWIIFERVYAQAKVGTWTCWDQAMRRDKSAGWKRSSWNGVRLHTTGSTACER